MLTPIRMRIMINAPINVLAVRGFPHGVVRLNISLQYNPPVALANSVRMKGTLTNVAIASVM